MKEEKLKNISNESLRALFDDHVSILVVQHKLNSFVDTLLLQIDSNNLGLQSGIKLTALVNIEDCHSVAVLIPSHHFHSLRILEQIIKHQLKILDTHTKQYAHNYLLNKNQLNLFSHV